MSGAILIGMMVVWHNTNRFANPAQTVSIQTLARYGESLYETVVSIELTLVLLAAPAATAGAICLDKARGTLDHMLATDLSNAEIVLGKIGVRLVPVLGLIACVLPLAALTSLLGGIDPLALFGSFMTSIACAALGCSLGLTISVWGRKTHEVLMTYLFDIDSLADQPRIAAIPDEFVRNLFPTNFCTDRFGNGWRVSNPYYLAFAPYSDPGKVGLMTYLGFLGVCFCPVRPAPVPGNTPNSRLALKQAGDPRPVLARRWPSRYFPTLPQWPVPPGPSLDGNPSCGVNGTDQGHRGCSRVVWILYTALESSGSCSRSRW